jgi:uncharacterized protein YndB with AHSA1/START domain
LNESTDRVERSVELEVPRSRVWKALTNAGEFGSWFGVHLEGKTFVAGERMLGRITYPGYEHLMMEMWIERIEPERLFSWRWHPAAIDPNVDYSTEPTTLVVFELREIDGRTLLSVVESGFDRIPVERRSTVIRLNTSGWEEQMSNVKKYVAEH